MIFSKGNVDNSQRKSVDSAEGVESEGMESQFLVESVHPSLKDEEKLGWLEIVTEDIVLPFFKYLVSEAFAKQSGSDMQSERGLRSRRNP